MAPVHSPVVTVEKGGGPTPLGPGAPWPLQPLQEGFLGRRTLRSSVRPRKFLTGNQQQEISEISDGKINVIDQRRERSAEISARARRVLYRVLTMVTTTAHPTAAMITAVIASAAYYDAEKRRCAAWPVRLRPIDAVEPSDASYIDVVLMANSVYDAIAAEADAARQAMYVARQVLAAERRHP